MLHILALLAATAVAFVITEGAKLEKSPIMGTKVTPIFSPAGVDPLTKNADVIFRLRTRERIEAWIEDNKGNRVRNLQAPRTFPRGSRLDLVWDGFTDNGGSARKVDEILFQATFILGAHPAHPF